MSLEDFAYQVVAQLDLRKNKATQFRITITSQFPARFQLTFVSKSARRTANFSP